ncbi:MAG: N-6 DNA methylase [Eggerthellaceae bacterium]|nr:N-6 DNA methylase [Eggerthellaceae bacterium]
MGARKSDVYWEGEPLRLKRGFLALACEELGMAEPAERELSIRDVRLQPVQDTVYSAVFARHGTRVDRATLLFLKGFQSGAAQCDDDPLPLAVAREIREHCLAGGRVAIVFPGGALSSAELGEGRAALLESGCLERVVSLPASCFEGSGRQGAVLLLSRSNDEVEFCRATIFGSPDLAKTSEHFSRPTGSLLEGKVRIDWDFLMLQADAPHLASHRSRTRLFNVARARMGLNPRRCGMRNAQKPDAEAYLVGPGDFNGGRWRKGVGIPMDPSTQVAARTTSAQPLKPGDIIVARAGAQARAQVFRGSVTQLYPHETLIVVSPAEGVDPHFVAAFLNGPSGLAVARSGGGTKHVSVQAIHDLFLPDNWSEIQSKVGREYREALVELEKAQRNVDSIERALSE